MKRISILLIVLLIYSAVSLFAQTNNLKISINILPQFEKIIKYEDINIQMGEKYNQIGNLVMFDSLSENSYLLRVAANVVIDRIDQDFVSYIPIKFSEKKDLNLTITFPQDCPNNRSSASSACPKCKNNNNVVPIRYGLPILDSLGNLPWKYEHILRGCIVPECPPHWYCKRHKLDF